MVLDIRTHIREFSRPFAERAGLKLFSGFADVVVLAATFFTVVHLVVSPALSRALFPTSYGRVNKKTRNSWSANAHVVSLVHAVIVVVLSSLCLHAKSLDEDRAFGSHEDATFVTAVACGYFIWDAAEAVIHFTDVGFVLHGFACLTIYVLATRPFVLYYSVRFLLWEVSTIFLDIHWFLDKTGKTGSTVQLINGFALLTTFFAVRLIWGGFMSYDFFVTMSEVYNELPLFYVVIYGGGNIVLQCLNWFWFNKMINALRKRFVVKPAKSKLNGQGPGNNDGKLEAHGHKDT
ncbi:DUF887-domain-containing protein [Phlebopus sp. FC_14]|nr:DUF887-domain-containing protein [Phlebopus sp. FC_14]